MSSLENPAIEAIKSNVFLMNSERNLGLLGKCLDLGYTSFNLHRNIALLMDSALFT